MNITVIVFEWEKIPFTEEELAKHRNDFDYGIYQVYGHHPAYGDDSLLYIGRSVDQLFSVRLKKRFAFIESAVRPTFILLGRIVKSSDKAIEIGWDINRWEEMLCKAEKILIKAHPPALNRQENTGLLVGEEFEKEPILLIHWGEYGRLSPETSTLRLSYKFWSFETPISKAALDVSSR